MTQLAITQLNSLTDESACHKNEEIQVMHLLIFPELKKQQEHEIKN